MGSEFNMDRIRQSFRRKRNKHKQSENTFDVENVFDSVEGEEDPKPLSRIQKIRQSLRTLKRKKKNTKDVDFDQELDHDEDEKLNFDTYDEDNIEEKIDDFSDKDEIDEVVLNKKSKFRFSFRKKKN